MFSQSLLFDMMLNTAFQDGIDNIQELIDKDMYLGKVESGSNSKQDTFFIFSYLAFQAVASG